jgi:PAS domain S-box-containing protein
MTTLTTFEPEHLARLIELSDDLICVGGADGYFFRVSPSWSRVLGYSEEELRSRPFLDFVHPEDAAATNREIRRVFRGAPSRQFANRIRHRDGHYRWLRWNVTPSHDAAYAYAVARDITDAHEANERLREQAELLRSTEQRLGAEIARAREIQVALMPELPLVLPWVQIAGQCFPAREMSGDFVDWYEVAGEKVALTVGDVMGKGVPAALLMSTTQTLLRAAAYGPDGLLSTGPADQIQRTNGALHSSLGAAQRFVTVFAGHLDRTGLLTYADAGHGHALIRRVDGSFERLDATGLPLGVEPGASYPSACVQLAPGDVVLVATDGLRDVLEGVSTGAWSVGISRAVSDWARADVIVNDLVLWAESATAGAGADDDLTVAAAVFYGEDGDFDRIDRPPPSWNYEVTVERSLHALEPHEAAARSFFREAGITGELVEELILGMHEVLANVVAHAEPTREIGLVIEVRVPRDGVTIEIVTSDDGRVYVEDDGGAVSVERGRGLEMCRALFDSVAYLREGETNLWVLNKFIPFAID